MPHTVLLAATDGLALKLAMFALGYLFGSVPFGLILTRAAGLGDIRKIGSGNIGATNVLRTGNKKLAAATLLLDVVKGIAAVAVAWILVNWLIGTVAVVPPIGDGNRVAVVTRSAAELAPYAFAAGYGAFLGHLYPVWLGFRGGKGVATYIGVLSALFWPAGVAFCLIWLLMAVAFRYSSLSALVAALLAPLVPAALGHLPVTLMLLPLSGLLIFKHHANIQRLLTGEEPKIGAKS